MTLNDRPRFSVEPRDVAIGALLVVSLPAWNGGLRTLATFCWLVAALLMWTRNTSRNVWWYAATLPFQLPQSAILARLSVADLFVLPLIAREALTIVRTRRFSQSTFRAPLYCLVVVFAVATVVGVVRTGQVSTWALLNKDAGLLLLIGAFAVVVRTVRTLDDVKRLALWFVGGVAIANITSLLGVAAAFAGYENDLYLIGNGRLYGWMGNPSVNGGLLFTAGMIEMGMLMAPASAVEYRRWRWANVWLMAVGLALTLSRSTWVAVAAAAAVLLVAALVHAVLAKEWRLAHLSAVAVWMLLPLLMLGNIVRLRGGLDLVSPDVVAGELQARLVDQCVENPSLDVCATVQMPPGVTAAAAPPPSAPPPSAAPPSVASASVPSPSQPGSEPVASQPAVVTAAVPDASAPRAGVEVTPVAPPAAAAAPDAPGSKPSSDAAAPAPPPPAEPEPEPPVPVEVSTPALAGPLMNARGLNDRVAIVGAAWNQYWADGLSRVTGIGLGTFYATSGSAFGVPLIIHNTFVWFLVEFGPIGLAVVLWIWWRTFSNLWVAAFQRNGGEYVAYGAMAAFAGLTMFCLLNEGFYQRQLWLVFAIADRLHALAGTAVVTARVVERPPDPAELVRV